MNKKLLLILCLGFFLGTTAVSRAQEKTAKETKKKNNKPEVEEEGPYVYKFDPNYEAAQEQRMAEFKRRKAVIDTMNISERKRRKLLQDLYRTRGSKRLNKAQVTAIKFEDSKN